MLRAQREDGNHHTGGPPGLLAQPQMTTVQHQHLTVLDLGVNSAVVALLPLQQLVALLVHDYIFIFYRQQPSLGVDREHPLVPAGILHLQIAAGAPRADGRMTAADSHHLSRLQLGSRHAEDDGAPEQWLLQHAHLLVALSVNGSQIGIGIQVQGQGPVAPLVGEHIVPGSVEGIDARHHVPLAAQHPPIGVRHLVAIDHVRQRVLPAHQGRRLQRPQLAIVRLHQQILTAHHAVPAMEIYIHMQAFAPCGMVVYGEFQFHFFTI